MRFYFQAQGMPRPAMWNNLAFVLVNALLNWTFVFGGPFQYAPFGWRGFGFVGAAMSISTSRCLQPLTYWLYMFAYRKVALPPHSRPPPRRLPSPSIAKHRQVV